MAVSSHHVALGPITAFQRDVAVWVRRAGRALPELLLLGLSLAPDLQAAGGAAASGRYLPAIHPLMAWSIALSTLLCYYPLELPISALARVGELFGICRRDHSG